MLNSSDSGLFYSCVDTDSRLIVVLYKYVIFCQGLGKTLFTFFHTLKEKVIFFVW